MFDLHSLKPMAAAAAGALMLTCVYAQTAPPPPGGQPAARQKAVKDQGELEIYNLAIKDAANPQKAIQDLDTWTQKYSDSDFKDDRLYMYLDAYRRMVPPQQQKVIDYGQQSRDLHGDGTECDYRWRPGESSEQRQRATLARG